MHKKSQKYLKPWSLLFMRSAKHNFHQNSFQLLFTFLLLTAVLIQLLSSICQSSHAIRRNRLPVQSRKKCLSTNVTMIVCNRFSTEGGCWVYHWNLHVPTEPWKRREKSKKRYSIIMLPSSSILIIQSRSDKTNASHELTAPRVKEARKIHMNLKDNIYELLSITLDL